MRSSMSTVVLAKSCRNAGRSYVRWRENEEDAVMEKVMEETWVSYKGPDVHVYQLEAVSGCSNDFVL